MTIYKHKKRGTEYVLVGIGKMQSENWQVSKGIFDYPADMKEVVIYFKADNPKEIWVRPKEEFFDGRFEEVTQ